MTSASPRQSELLAADRDSLRELAPLLRRAVQLDGNALTRLRFGASTLAAYVRLPFDVLVSRAVTTGRPEQPADVTLRAADVLAWLDARGTGDTAENADADGRLRTPPLRLDDQWRGGLPPASGWRRLDSVPEEVIRRLVRAGAEALQSAGEREGLAGGEPRSQAADAMLDSIVLTVSGPDGGTAEIPLRAVTALTRMGFVPEGSSVHVDVAGRWVRLAAQYGSVHLERPGQGLGLSRAPR